MRKTKKGQVVKLNLAVDKDFYDVLFKKAQNDYVKVATWVKQYLKKNLLEKNN